MDSKQPEVIILGAGLAGLTAAYHLQKARIPYLVLEARDRLGGRMYTVESPVGGTIEMGATWFADKHRHLIDLANELDVPFEEQYVGTKALYDYRNPQRVTQLVDIPPVTEPTYIFSKSSESLIHSLYDRLERDIVLLGHPVKSIHLKGEFWNIQTESQDLTSRYIINTLPPNLFVNSIHIDPALPKELETLLKQTHTWMGESIKVGLGFENDFWRKEGFGVIFSQFGPATELHDHIHDHQPYPILKGFIDSSFHELGTAKREELVRNQIIFFFPDLKNKTISYHELDWQEEKATYFPYQDQVYPHQNNGHPAFRKGYFSDQLFFAGSESAQNFPGYMDGAVERGVEVARTIAEKVK